jgi:hypothetical protein
MPFALEVENEIDEAVADGDHMTTEELLAWSDRLLRDDNFDFEAEERKAKAAIRNIRRFPQGQWKAVEAFRSKIQLMPTRRV